MIATIFKLTYLEGNKFSPKKRSTIFNTRAWTSNGCKFCFCSMFRIHPNCKLGCQETDNFCPIYIQNYQIAYFLQNFHVNDESVPQQKEKTTTMEFTRPGLLYGSFSAFDHYVKKSSYNKTGSSRPRRARVQNCVKPVLYSSSWQRYLVGTSNSLRTIKENRKLAEGSLFPMQWSMDLCHPENNGPLFTIFQRSLHQFQVRCIIFFKSRKSAAIGIS